MKLHPKELNVKEWIKRATDDELSAKAILEDRDGAPGTVCFLSQQMAEKYLKAFLVVKQKDFPKIHQLDQLLALCLKTDQNFEDLKKDAVSISDYWVDARYPGDYPEFSWKDAEEAFEAATRIKEFVLGKIKNE